jgi:hypothetical protein
MHALILMSPSRQGPPDAELRMEHERFIDGLDQANKVVLGGGWEPAAAGYEAAYLVSCESPEEAHAIAASDPSYARMRSAAKWWSGSSSA